MTEKKRVIALGFFDGVHLGHAALMNKAVEVGAEKGFIPSVMTFDTHPVSLVFGQPVPLINSSTDRAGIIERKFGINDIIILKFDEKTASLKWNEFIRLLFGKYNACHLVAGQDFRFGSGGGGDSEKLLAECKRLGLGCDIIPEVSLDGVAVRSTVIRVQLLKGEIEKANRFLGHPHVLTGFVCRGQQLGGKLGFPTANMNFEKDVLSPAFGVYATKVILDNRSEFFSITNVGVRPTVDDTNTIYAETHIFDFDGILYDKQLRIEFHSYMRKETKFSDISKLKEQISDDCKAVLKFFNVI